MEENYIKVDKGDGWEIYGLNESGEEFIIKKLKRLNQMNSGFSALPASTLMGLVAEFDSIVADIAKCMLKLNMNPASFSEKSIPVQDIFSYSSLDEVKERIISDEIYNLLRGSHDEQINFIEKKFNVNIRDSWIRWADFIEIFERRNLIAHGEKLYTKRYVDIISRHGNSLNNGVVGDEVVLDAKYLYHCVDILLEFCILINFMLSNKKFKDDRENSYSKLNHYAYTLIEQGRCEVAERILEYALILKSNCSDLTRRMMIINRANALKKLERSEECKKLLQLTDWSATSDSFKICVAAIEDDVDEVVKLMSVVVNANSVSKNEFRAWPVFYTVRKQAKFQNEFKKIFRESLEYPIGKNLLPNKDDSKSVH